MISLLEKILIKAQVGRYKDNATNRRLHRVGQPYGNKKEDDNNDTETTKVHNNAHRQSRRLPEFENLYKSCEELSDEQVRGFRTGRRELSEEELSSIGGILGRQIASVRNSNRAVAPFLVIKSTTLLPRYPSPHLFSNAFSIFKINRPNQTSGKDPL